MWQSCVEIKRYFVVHFELICTRLIRYLCTYAVRMSPTLNGSSALQHFEHGNAVEIHNGIIFDFNALKLIFKWS